MHSNYSTMLLSSAGHVADMISRMKNNRSLRKKKAYFNTEDPIVLKEKHQNLHFKKVSRETKSRFLNKISLQTTKRKRYERIVLAAMAIIMIGFIWYLKNYT